MNSLPELPVLTESFVENEPNKKKLDPRDFGNVRLGKTRRNRWKIDIPLKERYPKSMMSDRFNQRLARSGRALRRAPRWICHFAVLLAVWQGPVPWCHAHGNIADARAASEAKSTSTADLPVNELAVHLCLFHPAMGVHEEDLGWHFHFRMPGGGGDKNSESSATRTGLLRLKAERTEAGGERSETPTSTCMTISTGDVSDLVAQATRMQLQSEQLAIRDFSSRLGLLQRLCSYRL